VQRLDGAFVFSASDLNNYLECLHLTELDRAAAAGLRERPPRAEESLIATKGLEHERRHLERLRVEYGDALVAFGDDPHSGAAAMLAAEAETIAAMERGARLIYQATFFDGRFYGRADFLRRVEHPCERWAYSYEVIDTKLALSTKPYFLVQLCNYGEHLERIQGKPQGDYAPRAHIVLGDGDERSFRVADYAAYYRHLKSAFLARVESGGYETYPYEVAHCAVCRWTQVCRQRRDDDDHLSIVAGIRKAQIKRLEEHEIATVAALAAAGDDDRPERMSGATFSDLRVQSALQNRQREAEARGEAFPYAYAFREAEEAAGFAHLPKPARGDVFFDIEGDPLYLPGRGLEYLFGLYLPDEPEGAKYRAFWATDATKEQAAFEALVDFLTERRRAFPGSHVYHYASYETSALKRLMGHYGTREAEVDALVSSGAFVDLYPVVKQAMWISQPSYGLKKVEKLYGMERSAEVKAGDDSIVMFESWRASGDGAILEDIERYNEEDVVSTYRLRDWLLERREEFAAGQGEPMPWREDAVPRPPEDDAERTALEARLLDGLLPPESLAALRDLAEPDRARWLLGNLLQYHRRENKPEWWKYFQRCENPQDLREFDRDAMGGLVLRYDVAPYKVGPKDRNLVYTYTFPPQEHYLGANPHSPFDRCAAGTVVALDDAEGTIALKLASKIAPESLRALIPGSPLPIRKQTEAMQALAQAYLAGALEPATLQMLLARPPRLTGFAENARLQPEDVTAEALSAAIGALDASYLFVQGPPGSGKTTKGARAIVDLLASGKRVAIAANGHKAVHNLLHKVEEVARARGVRFRGAHRHSDLNEGSAYVSRATDPLIESASDADGTGYDLFSSSLYSWTSRDFGSWDALFIDEAGQVALADALIASRAARNVVLLGDPLQLPQVVQGYHPIGTARSILQHLLGPDATVRPTRGIFLDTSYRMHPSIRAFVSDAIYESRITKDGDTIGNAVRASGLGGSGLRYVPVVHEGNGRYSVEESEAIAREAARLLAGTVSVDGRPHRPMTTDDILVVAPYNLQRREIARALAAAGIHGVRVGTVDKFQGQEAPVVFYSMATSSGDDVPRDAAFLFDRNRFNVAISRAQCLSVLVCSPRLLDLRCGSVETMALANLLCAFVERAETVAD